MRIISYLIIATTLGSVNLFGQVRDISAKHFESFRTKTSQFLTDTTSIVDKGGAPLEVKHFSIKFSSVKFNLKDSVLELEGRIYERNEKYGLPGADLFKAVRIGDTLMKRQPLLLSNYDANRPENNGLFRLKTKVAKDEKLYFRFSFYYLEEYAICKLLD